MMQAFIPPRPALLPSSVVPKMSLSPRPPGKPFTLPFRSLTLRSYATSDGGLPAAAIASCLLPYGLLWDATPGGADADAAAPAAHYPPPRAEFWVVCDAAGAVVGTAAFRPWAGASGRGDSAAAAEIRKMYLLPAARGNGLGAFLLQALEDRCEQLGYEVAVLETAAVLEEACALYRSRGYVDACGTEVETERCDMVLEKTLGGEDARRRAQGGPERVPVVDEAGYVITEVERAWAREARLLYAAVVVLVMTQEGDEVFVQRRSGRKKAFPNCIDPFVAGGVDAVADPSSLHAAERETEEELALSPHLFHWTPLWDGAPFLYDRGEGTGDRCSFRGYVARARVGKGDLQVKFADGEVSEGFWASRAQVDAEARNGTLPSPVWKYVSTLDAPPCLSDCSFFKGSN